MGILIIDKPDCNMIGGIPIVSLDKKGFIYTLEEIHNSFVTHLSSYDRGLLKLFTYWFNMSFKYYLNFKFIIYDK